MDYNVVANLAGNLGNFSKTFKSYISRCDKSNRVISTAEEKMATYADMTLMDYYVDKHMEEFLTNPLLATKDEKQREAWIELERKHAEQKFEAISAAERANIETEYEALRDEALSVKNHAKIAIEQEKILKEKESLYQAIDEVREKNAESRELIEAEIVALQNRDIRVLEQNIKDLNRQLIEAAKKANSAEVAELEAVYGDKIKKVEEQIAAVNEKVAFYNNVLELLDAFESELTDVSVRNENIAELFKVNFEESTFNIKGQDDIEFMISFNLGEDIKPIYKVASGGEMSRFMLAIKNVLADVDKIPVIIFDEIDTGISGVAANVTGEKIKQISKSHQVICVTHLASIAAKGDYNYYICKEIENGKTKTKVRQLNEEEVLKEIARISTGSVSEISINHARELRRMTLKEIA